MDARADNTAAFSDGSQGERNQTANRRKNDRCVKRPWWHFV